MGSDLRALLKDLSEPLDRSRELRHQAQQESPSPEISNSFDSMDSKCERCTDRLDVTDVDLGEPVPPRCEAQVLDLEPLRSEDSDLRELVSLAITRGAWDRPVRTQALLEAHGKTTEGLERAQLLPLVFISPETLQELKEHQETEIGAQWVSVPPPKDLLTPDNFQNPTIRSGWVFVKQTLPSAYVPTSDTTSVYPSDYVVLKLTTHGQQEQESTERLKGAAKKLSRRFLNMFYSVIEEMTGVEVEGSNSMCETMSASTYSIATTMSQGSLSGGSNPEIPNSDLLRSYSGNSDRDLKSSESSVEEFTAWPVWRDTPKETPRETPSKELSDCPATDNSSSADEADFTVSSSIAPCYEEDELP